MAIATFVNVAPQVTHYELARSRACFSWPRLLAPFNPFTRFPVNCQLGERSQSLPDLVASRSIATTRLAVPDFESSWNPARIEGEPVRRPRACSIVESSKRNFKDPLYSNLQLKVARLFSTTFQRNISPPVSIARTRLPLWTACSMVGED